MSKTKQTKKHYNKWHCDFRLTRSHHSISSLSDLICELWARCMCNTFIQLGNLLFKTSLAYSRENNTYLDKKFLKREYARQIVKNQGNLFAS